MRKIIFAILALVFWFFLISYLTAFYNLLDKNSFSSGQMKAFLIGILAGIIFWAIFGRYLEFFHILEHELTHLIVGLIFFKKPKQLFVVHDVGGGVMLDGYNFLIFLAPYFLPTFSFLMLPFSFLIKSKFIIHYIFALGIVTGYHIISTVKETKPSQPDLKAFGLFFSYSFIAFANIVCYGYLFYFVDGNFSRAWKFLKEGFFVFKSLLLRFIG